MLRDKIIMLLHIITMKLYFHVSTDKCVLAMTRLSGYAIYQFIIRGEFMVGAVGGQSSGNNVTGKNVTLVLCLVFAVFFILGGVTNINDVLIPKLKGLYQLSNFQANLVQFAFFTSYAIFSIPAGILLSKLGYIRGFVTGFVIVAIGSLLFLPAANTGIYVSFLAALFVIGGGITMLQVAMNPVIVMLGDPAKASSRLTFAQSFNSVGVFLMVLGGAELMLGESSTVDPTTLSGQALTDFRIAESAIIGQAYVGLAIAMSLIALLFWVWRSVLDGQKVESVKTEGTLDLFLNNKRLQFGALCIFAYVGAEVAIGSNLVEYLGDERVMGLSNEDAGPLFSLYWGAAMVGRLLGGFILRSSTRDVIYITIAFLGAGFMFVSAYLTGTIQGYAYAIAVSSVLIGIYWIGSKLEGILPESEAVKSGTILSAAAIINVILLIVSATTSGALAGWTLIIIGLFNSIMFPTIFSIATQGLGEKAAQASGILCTAIVGGALVPPLLGLVADISGLAVALIVPLVCYVIISSFGFYANKNNVVG